MMQCEVLQHISDSAQRAGDSEQTVMLNLGVEEFLFSCDFVYTECTQIYTQRVCLKGPLDLRALGVTVRMAAGVSDFEQHADTGLYNLCIEQNLKALRFDLDWRFLRVETLYIQTLSSLLRS